MNTQSRCTFNPIMVAMDVGSSKEALSIARQLIQADAKKTSTTEGTEKKGCMPYVKVGMQLFYACGPRVIKALKELGFRIFLDLKLHDIPNTVKGAAKSLTQLGVDMFNVHAAGGSEMMKAALIGVEEGLQAVSSLPTPKVIAVTQLTSTDQTMLNEELNIPGTVHDQVLHYAELTQQSGLDGVVCSPLEVPRIKDICGQAFMTVTPGIRLAEGKHHDQARVTTPLKAQQLGSDYMVLGRAITEAENPRQTYRQILQQLCER